MPLRVIIQPARTTEIVLVTVPYLLFRPMALELEGRQFQHFAPSTRPPRPLLQLEMKDTNHCSKVIWWSDRLCCFSAIVIAKPYFSTVVTL